MVTLKLEKAKETYFQGVEDNQPNCIHHDHFFGEDGCHSKAQWKTEFCGEMWFACSEHKKALNSEWEPQLAEDAELPSWELIETECTWCGKDLSKSQILRPTESDHGDIICDGCYRQEYMELCIICEKWVQEDETDFIVIEEGNTAYGDHLVKGVYEIVDTPYYVDNVLSVKIIADAVEKVRDVEEEELEVANSGWVCDECALAGVRKNSGDGNDG